jgi:hypothetical protein
MPPLKAGVERPPAELAFEMGSFVPLTLRPYLAWFQPNLGCDDRRIKVSDHGYVCVLLVVFGHLKFSVKPAVAKLPQSPVVGKFDKIVRIALLFGHGGGSVSRQSVTHLAIQSISDAVLAALSKTI